MPAVPASHLRPEALKARFAQPPVWQPEIKRETSFSSRQPAQAAVLVPIVLRDTGPTILLTQRTAHLSTHSGQIAFPGGKVDEEDVSRQATALREAQEEVGLDPRHVRVIGELPVYITGTAFWVTPVIGLVSPELAISPNADEVDDVFEVPLAFLMDPANHRRHSMDWSGARREWFSMLYTTPGLAAHGETGATERFIWGATAAMLRNFYRFLVVSPAG